MSFFGFDSSLPAAGTQLEERLATYEETDIYDFGGDAYHDLLAAKLDEGAINDFNDETFGAEQLEAAPVGRDFDFAGTTNRYLQPALSAYSALDADPLLSRTPLPPRLSTPAHSLYSPQQLPPSPFQHSQPPQPVRRTLEDIEAEQRAAAQSSYAPPQPLPPARRPLTLEEVEAEMLNQRRAPPPIQQQPLPPPQSFQQIPPPHQQPYPQQRQPILPPSMQQSQSPPPTQFQNIPPPNSMLGTLFPPLPSQAQAPATVEQQLQYLTMNQHVQHPSLTAAQLQALLQQARARVGTEAVDGEAQLSAVAGEELIRSVEMRIREHEMMEHKRKRKAAKIASMAKHNNIMTNSDKDFITRIQVSQLVTDDPYADDFYFHIMAAIKASRHAAVANAGLAQTNNQNAPPGEGRSNGNGGGGRRGGERKPTRRENAMNKMALNVQRLVDVAKQRNKSGQLNLDGALGKIALRTRSAPRQLLQVSGAAPSAGHTLLAGLISGSVENTSASNGDRKALTHRAVLIILEQIYDSVLDLEQLKRVQPGLLAAARMAASKEEDVEGIAQTAFALEEWDAKYAELAAKLWNSLRVMEPLDAAVTHPFISLISVLKGKRILPRALRHTSPEQTLTLLTLMVATFDTLDTVRDAYMLDASDDSARLSTGSLENNQQRAAVEAKTEVFLNAIISPVMGVIAQAPLRIVTGMLGLMLERNDIIKVARSKPGIAFLTIFLSRAESLKQKTPPPDPQDLLQWQQIFTHFFNLLSHEFPSLFPSTRAVSSLPFGASYYLSGQAASSLNTMRPDIDLDDEPVWRFLAALAVSADPGEQQLLVTAVRDKVLEHVTSATKQWITPEVAALKIRNVNLLLNSLGLDSSDIVPS